MHKFTKDQQIIISCHKFNFIRMYYCNFKWPNLKDYSTSTLNRKLMYHILFSKKLY